MNAWLDEHTYVTGTQIKEQNIISISEPLLVLHSPEFHHLFIHYAIESTWVLSHFVYYK